ncbi:hypothetical protein [Subtercola lobariae]|uniref:hypothetical protein n=1 Tax=Subtercola lobariae TaxID=1588641 RepID=UPI0016636932
MTAAVLVMVRVDAGTLDLTGAATVDVAHACAAESAHGGDHRLQNDHVDATVLHRLALRDPGDLHDVVGGRAVEVAVGHVTHELFCQGLCVRRDGADAHGAASSSGGRCSCCRRGCRSCTRGDAGLVLLLSRGEVLLQRNQLRLKFFLVSGLLVQSGDHVLLSLCGGLQRGLSGRCEAGKSILRHLSLFADGCCGVAVLLGLIVDLGDGLGEFAHGAELREQVGLLFGATAEQQAGDVVAAARTRELCGDEGGLAARGVGLRLPGSGTRGERVGLALPRGEGGLCGVVF